MLFKWDEADPLAGWRPATVGAYPHSDDGSLPDYERLFCETLNATVRLLKPDGKLSPSFLKLVTPNAITEFDLYLKQAMGFGRGDGIYVAGGSDFIDLVNFWNLRAGGENLLFHSVAARERLESVKESYLARLEKSRRGGQNEQIEIAVWGRDRSLIESLGLKNCSYCELRPGEWHFSKTWATSLCIVTASFSLGCDQ